MTSQDDTTCRLLWQGFLLYLWKILRFHEDTEAPTLRSILHGAKEITRAGIGQVRRVDVLIPHRQEHVLTVDHLAPEMS